MGIQKRRGSTFTLTFKVVDMRAFSTLSPSLISILQLSTFIFMFNFFFEFLWFCSLFFAKINWFAGLGDDESFFCLILISHIHVYELFCFHEILSWIFFKYWFSWFIVDAMCRSFRMVLWTNTTYDLNIADNIYFLSTNYDVRMIKMVGLLIAMSFPCLC